MVPAWISLPVLQPCCFWDKSNFPPSAEVSSLPSNLTSCGNFEDRKLCNPGLPGVTQVAHTRLPSVGFCQFWSWSRFLAVSLQVKSHKPVGRLPLLSATPAVTPATLKRAATSFAAWWTEAQWVWTVCLRLLPDSIATAIWTQALLRLSPAR